MEGKLSLLTTLDGSFTFYNQQIHQSYHSVNGALQESTHVFLENGLENYLQIYKPGQISILEVGFGSGLNFLVIADYCESKKILLTYTGIEPYLIERSLLENSQYHKWIRHQLLWDTFINSYSEEMEDQQQTQLSLFVHLNLIKTTLLEYNTNATYDLIFFDAFAPATQPELWQEESILHALSMLKPEGRFISYSITGDLKRILRAQGYTIEKPKGAAGKREMLRTYKKLTL